VFKTNMYFANVFLPNAHLRDALAPFLDGHEDVIAHGNPFAPLFRWFIVPVAPLRSRIIQAKKALTAHAFTVGVQMRVRSASHSVSSGILGFAKSTTAFAFAVACILLLLLVVEGSHLALLGRRSCTTLQVSESYGKVEQLPEWWACVDSVVERAGAHARIYLATDNPAVQESAVERYGSKVLMIRKLNTIVSQFLTRKSMEMVSDALVDIFLLINCQVRNAQR
jgi:hypothetical protein